MTNTPGTWRLGKQNDTVVTDVTQDTDLDHAFYYGGEVIAESISSNADRHLISAAPEMLDALLQVRKYFKDDVHNLNFQEMIEDAISKAKGEVK